MKPHKQILCLDFDGVLHSYTSGWKGARNIPDPPVPGALEFLTEATNHFRVAIFSSRSHQWGGRHAMKRWLRGHLLALAPAYETTPPWLRERIAKVAFADPWADDARFAVRNIVRNIEWPRAKPPAHVTIDDRAMTFGGDWSAFPLDQLAAFRPWNKRAA